MYFDFFCYTPLARTTTLLLSRGFPFPSPCTEKQARRRQDPSPRRGLQHKSVMFQTSADSRGHLLCPLSSPLPTPALTKACSSFKTVRTPKTTGVPVWSWTFIKPCDTASQMYSKCMVDPLIRHPIAMTASNGAVDWDGVGVWGCWVDEVLSMSERRLVVDASMEGAALADWVLPASMSLSSVRRIHQGITTLTFCRQEEARSCLRRS